MLPSEPALSVLPGPLFACTVQNFRDLVSNTTLALRLLFEMPHHLVASNGETPTAGGILGHVKPDALL